MAWTKRQLVEQAFDELALAAYVYDLTPEELQSALRRMDGMIAVWSAAGLTLPYALASSPDEASLDTDSGLPMIANEAVYLGLAVRTAASKGKVLSPSTKAAARGAYEALVSYVARQQAQEQQMPAGTPRGAGRKPWRNVTQPFLPQPDGSPLQLAGDGGLDFSGA